jgi:hypothetical protein
MSKLILYFFRLLKAHDSPAQSIALRWVLSGFQPVLVGAGFACALIQGEQTSPLQKTKTTARSRSFPNEEEQEILPLSGQESPFNCLQVLSYVYPELVSRLLVTRNL